MKTFERILVPTDFSECSRAALAYAVELAGRFGGAVEVVHVLDLPHYLEGQIMVPTTGGASEPLEAILMRRAEQEMERFLSGTRVAKVRFGSGNPVDAIVELAAEGKYDLVVMGTHGKRHGVLTGSVTERVVRRAPCPVLTFREGANDAVAIAS